MYLFSLNIKPKEYVDEANQKVVIGITLGMDIKPVDSFSRLCKIRLKAY
jgi:hypothetical protein